MKERKNPADLASRFQASYPFMPLFSEPPRAIPLQDLARALAKRVGEVEAFAGKGRFPAPGGGAVGFASLGHLPGGGAPTALFLGAGGEFDARYWWDEAARGQIATLEDSEAMALLCRFYLDAFNANGSLLPPHEEYGLIAGLADAVLDAWPECIGFWWPCSQSLVPRERWRRSRFGAEELHFLEGGLNVRNFTAPGRGDFVDTLGLAAIGLPDVELFASGLSLDGALSCAQNTAVYMYQEGDVVEDGDTVGGPEGSNWRALRRRSALAPYREVLSLERIG